MLSHPKTSTKIPAEFSKSSISNDEFMNWQRDICIYYAASNAEKNTKIRLNYIIYPTRPRVEYGKGPHIPFFTRWISVSYFWSTNGIGVLCHISRVGGWDILLTPQLWSIFDWKLIIETLKLKFQIETGMKLFSLCAALQSCSWT